ncbi:MAG: PadR family transcriptional regulator [Pseudomonadota bacterium]
MSMELITLGFLMSGAKTGYKLQGIANNMMPFYSVSHNQVYPVLRKLEKAGHVEKEVVFQTGKPNKNLFRLTDRGREYFYKKLTDAPAPLDIYLPFLIRFFFFRFLEEGQVERELEKEVKALGEQLRDLRAVEPVVDEHADENGDFIFRTAAFMVGALRDWYERELINRQGTGR